MQTPVVTVDGSTASSQWILLTTCKRDTQRPSRSWINTHLVKRAPVAARRRCSNVSRPRRLCHILQTASHPSATPVSGDPCTRGAQAPLGALTWGSGLLGLPPPNQPLSQPPPPLPPLLPSPAGKPSGRGSSPKGAADPSGAAMGAEGSCIGPATRARQQWLRHLVPLFL